MPIIELNRDQLFKRLGKEYSVKEFEKLCFDFGIELDDVTSKYEEIKREKGEDAPELETADKSVLYKIEIPANRYDLLCMEGLVRALRLFQEFDKQSPQYQTTYPINSGEEIIIRVTKTTKQIRPYIVGAVLRNIRFTEESFDSFMKLQEKLHFNICRRRKLVAIGTHDLDSLKPPFLYDAREPKNIMFKALKEEKSMDAQELFHEYNERKVCALKPYLPIIENSPVYPIIYDDNNVVLSLPPVINGEHSKMSLNTKNVFIESTATDLTKANIVLNIMCSMFSEYCEEPFTVEQVKVTYDENVTSGDGKIFSEYYTPNFTPTNFTTTTQYINKGLGTKLPTKLIISLLQRMGLDALISEKTDENKEDINNDNIIVNAPITRSDILHPVDIQEDVAIAYGFNNISRQLPSRSTTGSEFKLNSLSDKIRECIALSGYCEVLNWALISKDENYNKMRINDNGYAVELMNPKTPDFQICRTNLLPGILRTLSENVGHAQLPLKLFEVGDIVLCDDRQFVKARNERRLSALICNTQNTGLELIHGLLDRIMNQNEFEFLSQKELLNNYKNIWPQYNRKKNTKRYYSLKESDRPSFFPQRQAAILIDNKVAGYFGMVHPQVVKNFGIFKITNVFVSAIEMSCEPFR